jgi:ankyrin repeat protein
MDPEGNNVDHHVVVRRTVDQIRREADSGLLNPLVEDRSRQNLLHVAVAKNNFGIIQYLGEEWDGDRTELVSAVDLYRKTPLHTACYAAAPNLDVVECLLDVFRAHEVVRLWSADSTNSPLHIAIRRENVELVNLLVSRAVLGFTHPSSFLESRDCNGRTPLLFACTCAYHNPSIVRCLVQWERPRGLNSRMWQPRDKDGRIALHLACESYACLEQVTELVNNYNDDVEAQDSTNMRPLHVAVAFVASQIGNAANLRIVQFLVTEARADVNAKDGKGWTPLHYACQRNSSRNTDLIRLLVENGAETGSGDTIGRTPLHVASQSIISWLVEHLVEKEGAAVDLRDSEGNTSLHVACSSGNFAVASYLLLQRADADAENVHKQRPIHLACTNVRYDILRLLVESFGADVNAADRYWQTPLHKACMSNVAHANNPAGSPVVQCLLDNGANVNARDEDGKTPLLYAVSKCNIERARLLLSFGANSLCTDRHQNHVLHVARTADMARLLIEDMTPSAIARGVAHTLLTSTNFRGQTPIKIVNRRLWHGRCSEGMKLRAYILSLRSFRWLLFLLKTSKTTRNEKYLTWNAQDLKHVPN